MGTALQQKGFSIQNGLGNAPFDGKRVLCFDTDRPSESFRLIENAFNKSVSFLKKASNKGFFLMVEGAKNGWRQPW